MPVLLIIIGIVLIVYSYSDIKKSNNTSFKITLNEEKENLDDYKLEIGRLRKDIGESLTELQEEIKNIKINLNMSKDIEEMYENESDVLNNMNEVSKYDMELNSSNVTLIEEENDVISDINFEHKVDNDLNKSDSINELIKQGLNDDEISQKLSVSKGEVLLVRNLFKN
ncbi:hypothetical protein [Clostridium weizhouense]|uniref:Uncharacterized protein n=1 Tax=Clostridium weizhouense TaxID=2859781 RepID=A0ABS7AM18_9CLOT|nr:hypothetical protein [Clostridium weizhouense]MBW6408540.1 hypothetical protein [Clostridium weizhouense]